MLDFRTRSEAHFAAMLYSDLKSNPSMQTRFVKEVERLAGRVPGRVVDVCVEQAPFRDGWWDLDERRRRLVIDELLRRVAPHIGAGQFAWMLDSKGKLRSPASWKSAKVKEEAPELRRLCFMFRARADILVETTSMAVWVELKVDSRTPTEREDTYHQPSTQRDIAKLAHLMIPGLERLHPLNLLIQRKPSKTPFVATWNAVVDADLPHWKSSRLFARSGQGTGE